MTTTVCPDPYPASTPAQPEEVSLYDAIGGRAALVAAVDVFYRRVLADPELGPFFPAGVGERHRAYLTTFLGEALGGPRRYRGPDIAAAHRGLGISDVHFVRVAGHLVATLDELGVPRHLTDQIIGIVATLQPAVVTA
jgi:hemoglobin